MKSYTSEQLRNVVVIGHGGSGKTTLGEAMLFASGAISRMGSIESSNTVGDFDELEHAHSYSISASLLAIEWNDYRINLIDTPGFADFEGEVVEGCMAADAALIAVDAASGPQSGTESAWAHADQAGLLPRIILVTRLDRENADFDGVVAALRDQYGTKVIPLVVPDGVSGEFTNTIDLVNDSSDALSEAREMLVESVAETDDELLSRYLDGDEIASEQLSVALSAAVATGDVVPVVPVSATGVIGIRELLDQIVRLFPSPLGREHILEDGGTITTTVDGPMVASVFRTSADPFVGRLSFLKVLSGTLAPDHSPYNVHRSTVERLGHLFIQRGKEQIEVSELVAGDIGVVAKLTETVTGDTFVSSESESVRIVPAALPPSTYRSALHPRSKADVDKLSSALQKITEQDPTIHVDRNSDTAEIVMTTVGDAQVNIAASRLDGTYGVAVDVSVPRVPYKETVSIPTKSEYKHKKQSGGHGQYGHVVIEIQPLSRGDGFEFASRVVGGNVPRQFIPAVEKGLAEQLVDGPLAQSPIVDMRVTLLDGSAHSVDSSEMSFKIAASQALRQGMLDARPILLEPMMKLTIRIPSEYMGDIMGDLNTRRGQVEGVEPEGPYSVIRAQAPLSEVQRYMTDVRALTQGRGRFEIEFDRYVEVPANVQGQVLKEMSVEAQADN